MSRKHNQKLRGTELDSMSLFVNEDHLLKVSLSHNHWECRSWKYLPLGAGKEKGKQKGDGGSRKAWPLDKQECGDMGLCDGGHARHGTSGPGHKPAVLHPFSWLLKPGGLGPGGVSDLQKSQLPGLAQPSSDCVSYLLDGSNDPFTVVTSEHEEDICLHDNSEQSKTPVIQDQGKEFPVCQSPLHEEP